MKRFVQIGLDNINVESCVIVDGTAIYPNYRCEDEKNDMYAQFVGASEKFIDTIDIKRIDDEIIVKRTLKNISKEILRINELEFDFYNLSFGGKQEEDYYYSVELPKFYRQFTFSVDENRTRDSIQESKFDEKGNNKWIDASSFHRRINRSGDQPFPAILISNYQAKTGVVHGSLSQDVFYHNYIVTHERGLELKVFSSFMNTDYIELNSGESLTDEWYFGLTNDADNIEKIFEKYTNRLRERLLGAYGCRNINRRDMVWGSWNDGVWRDISEKMLVDEARALKEHFPTVKWLQIDDGYATFNEKPHGLGVPYEGEIGVDKQKFPNGLKDFTDKIREIGLRPAIWIGGTVPNKTKLYQDHPEWFMGDMLCGIDSYVLDVSREDVREYMCSAIDTMLTEYKFEGLKHDFWSYPFESAKRFYKKKSKSGYQYRNWWLTEVRKRLPEDGYMQTGCAIAMGNPFLGKYYNNYRYGIDIGEGDWENIKTLFTWGAACLATHTGDLFIPNSDSFGFFPNLPNNVFMFWTNFLLITRTAVELSGRFTKEENLQSPRFPILKKATCNPNNGQDVYFVDFDYRKKDAVPEIFYLKTSLFASEENESLPMRTVALFNMSQESKQYVLTLKDLDLDKGEYVITDVWNEEMVEFDSQITFTVGAEQSRLFSITKKNKFALYDANIRLTNVRVENDSIVANTDYGAEAECTFENMPCKIIFNEHELPFKRKGRKLIFVVPSAGEIHFKMF